MTSGAHDHPDYALAESVDGQFAVLSGLAYATGNVGTVDADPNAGRPYARFHAWAAALLAFAVAAVAFAWFLL